MKKILGKLSWIAGTLLNAVTVVLMVIYLFGVLVWMHAPLIPALLLTLAMALPPFGLAWLLRRWGRFAFPRARPQPWYPPKNSE